MKKLFIFLVCIIYGNKNFAQQTGLIPIAKGWAKNTVNTVVFRKNAIVTYQDEQFVAFYNEDQKVVLAKRNLRSSVWQIVSTKFKGNTNDAHNAISIMVDGDGYLHLAWDHHNNQLHYSKSLAPRSLEMSEEVEMTGSVEQAVTYPEFYKMPNGDLLFLYRSGGSGKGNLVINKYDLKKKQWNQLYQNLIDGEAKRNAYWQAFVDVKGTIHLSWVWRESPDVASNHDLCYARSTDGGQTWEKSTGQKYQLPIREATAEYVCKIPQNSDLINQTSMYADDESNVSIATYWREKSDSTPQYHLVYNNGKKWTIQKLDLMKKQFSLSGLGSKQIPISRPQVISWSKKNKICTAIIFRAEEYNNRFYAAINYGLSTNQWQLKELTNFSLGSSEPLYDSELWKLKKQLHLYIQYSEQKDGEGKSNVVPQMVQVLQCDIK